MAFVSLRPRMFRLESFGVAGKQKIGSGRTENPLSAPDAASALWGPTTAYTRRSLRVSAAVLAGDRGVPCDLLWMCQFVISPPAVAPLLSATTGWFPPEPGTGGVA